MKYNDIVLGQEIKDVHGCWCRLARVCKVKTWTWSVLFYTQACSECEF